MNTNLKLGLIVISVLTLCFGGATLATGCDAVKDALGDGGAGTDGGGTDTDGGACTPACTDAVCGAADGCGAKCMGTCDEGKTCKSYQCVLDGCTPACDGKLCGEDDGCEGICTDCENADETCNLETGVCEAGTCEPVCGADSCGEDDGCGDYCYDCSGANEACNTTTWVCEDLGNCGDVTFAGCCDDAVATFCEGGEVQTVDCGENTDPAKKICGWAAATELGDIYDCGGSGEDPSGANPIACP